MIKRLFGQRLLERLAALQKLCDQQQAENEALVEQLRKRAYLTSINTNGRTLRLCFLRDGKPYVIETYATMDIDVTQLRKDLLSDG